MADMSAKAQYATDVQERLRALLLARFSLVDPNALATALAYELVSVLAENAPSIEAAEVAILTFPRLALEQVRAFGVGRPHP